MTTVADLGVGARGMVASIEGVDDISMRLLEMGITPGVEVQVIGKAILGDPIELQLRGYRLSVRMSEARRIRLESNPGA